MKAKLLKWLASWLYGITADQWVSALKWCAQLLRNDALTGAEKRVEVVTAFRQMWSVNHVGNSALNWLIETAVGIAKKKGAA
jgi:hypothetical protein